MPVALSSAPWPARLLPGARHRNGTLYNLSYGIVSAIEVESIRNKPVYHYRPDSRVMSIGSYGCNFRCKGCHNLEISWGVEALDKLARGQSTEAWITPEQMVETAFKHGVEGTAFTYSEPAVWLEYVLGSIRRAAELGIHVETRTNVIPTKNDNLEELAGIAEWIRDNLGADSPCM